MYINELVSFRADVSRNSRPKWSHYSLLPTKKKTRHLGTCMNVLMSSWADVSRNHNSPINKRWCYCHCQTPNKIAVYTYIYISAPEASQKPPRAQERANLKILTPKCISSRPGDTTVASLTDGNMDTPHIIHIHGRHSPSLLGSPSEIQEFSLS